MTARVLPRIPEDFMWVEDEGWVKLSELCRQVDRAFRDWRHRMAMRGVIVMDGYERTDVQIKRHLARHLGPKASTRILDVSSGVLA